MATSILIEEEAGSYARHIHGHNGYYAGDFSQSRRTAGRTPRAGRSPHAPRSPFGPERSL